MKNARVRSCFKPGATLAEAVIAVGVLAVAVPLVFGALAEAGKSGMAAEAETRSSWMVPACMEEIRASREGRPQYFTPTTTGQPFPSAGDVWALAFTAEGRAVGKISKTQSDKGLQELNGETVRYIALLNAAAETPVAGVTPMLRTRITIEYPAAAPAVKRSKLDFHTRIR
jgi:hypothetical protein